MNLSFGSSKDEVKMASYALAQKVKIEVISLRSWTILLQIEINHSNTFVLFNFHFNFQFNFFFNFQF